jgi:N-acetylated-alpha-linked acidic dipeptidase
LTSTRSTPNAESALAASRAYATHPHLAGSSEDFSDAKVILELFQTEFGISPPSTKPIFPAGSSESREATLNITNRENNKPSAWVDTYYPVLNTPLDRSLEILGENNDVVWSADLVEDGDPLDEDAHKYRDSVPAWHGLSKDGIAEGQLVYANYGTKEVWYLIFHG